MPQGPDSRRARRRLRMAVVGVLPVAVIGGIVVVTSHNSGSPQRQETTSTPHGAAQDAGASMPTPGGAGSASPPSHGSDGGGTTPTPGGAGGVSSTSPWGKATGNSRERITDPATRARILEEAARARQASRVDPNTLPQGGQSAAGLQPGMSFSDSGEPCPYLTPEEVSAHLGEEYRRWYGTGKDGWASCVFGGPGVGDARQVPLVSILVVSSRPPRPSPYDAHVHNMIAMYGVLKGAGGVPRKRPEWSPNAEILSLDGDSVAAVPVKDWILYVSIQGAGTGGPSPSIDTVVRAILPRVAAR